MSAAAFRLQAEAAMAALTAARTDQMVDAAFVTRPPDPGQTPELDADGNVVDEPPETVYDGPATFSQPTEADAQDQTTNDDSAVPVEAVLKVPHGAGLRPGDLVTVTAALFSPGLVGDRFVVVRQQEKSYAASERYSLRGSSWVSATTGG